jgi:hypothetical protein
MEIDIKKKPGRGKPGFVAHNWLFYLKVKLHMGEQLWEKKTEIENNRATIK